MNGDPSASHELQFRNPAVADARAVWRLVGEVGGLERNTSYAYLLLCSHFAPGCVLALRESAPVGFVLGYRPPVRPDVMFVWQVGVHPDLRGARLGGRLLDKFASLPHYTGCRYLEATVGAGNRVSRALFRSFARRRGAACEEGFGYPAGLFPEAHEDEDRFRIGPLKESKRP